MEGIFKKVKNIGIEIEASKSLKKFISSKIFKTKAKDMNIKNVLKRVKRNILPKYVWYTFSIMIFYS